MHSTEPRSSLQTEPLKMGIITNIFCQEGLVFEGDLLGRVDEKTGYSADELFEHVRSFRESSSEASYTFVAFKQLNNLFDGGGMVPTTTGCPHRDRTLKDYPNSNGCLCVLPRDQLVLIEGHGMTPAEIAVNAERARVLLLKLLSEEFECMFDGAEDEDEKKMLWHKKERLTLWTERRLKENVVMIGKVLMIYTA